MTILNILLSNVVVIFVVARPISLTPTQYHPFICSLSNSGHYCKTNSMCLGLQIMSVASVHLCLILCEDGVTSHCCLVSIRSDHLAFISMHLHALAPFPTPMAVTGTASNKPLFQ